MLKQISKKLIATATIMGVMGVFSVLSTAVAATEANVTATVTVQNISVTISAGGSTVAYGTIGLDTAVNTCSTAPNLAAAKTIQNNGNVIEDFTIKGVDTTDWTLGAPGSETYGHQFLAAACTTTFSGGTALDTTGKSLASDVAASGTTTLNLEIHTPTATEHFTEQTPNVTITASMAT